MERDKWAQTSSNSKLEHERRIKQLETQLQAYRNVNMELQMSNNTNEALNKKTAQLSAEIDGLKMFRATVL